MARAPRGSLGQIISLRLASPALRALDKLARKRGVVRSEVLRETIEVGMACLAGVAVESEAYILVRFSHPTVGWARGRKDAEAQLSQMFRGAPVLLYEEAAFIYSIVTGQAVLAGKARAESGENLFDEVNVEWLSRTHLA